MWVDKFYKRKHCLVFKKNKDKKVIFLYVKSQVKCSKVVKSLYDHQMVN